MAESFPPNDLEVERWATPPGKMYIPILYGQNHQPTRSGHPDQKGFGGGGGGPCTRGHSHRTTQSMAASLQVLVGWLVG